MGYWDNYDYYFNIGKREYYFENNFKGRLSETQSFNDYIERKTTNILRYCFDKYVNDIDLNHHIYNKLMSCEKISEILLYKEFGLTSPQIYNIVYLHLISKSYNKEQVKRTLEDEVNYNKNEMELIKQYGYNPITYRELKDNSSEKRLRINPDVYF